MKIIKTPYKEDNWFVCVSCYWVNDYREYVRSNVTFAVFLDHVIVEWAPDGPLTTFLIGKGDDIHWSGAKGTNSCGQTIVDDLGLAAASVDGQWDHIFYHINEIANSCGE